MGVKIEIFRLYGASGIGSGSYNGQAVTDNGRIGMMLYLSFPVTMFWISNQAQYFEEYVVKRKRDICPPGEEMQRQELENFKERMRERREHRLLKQAGLVSEE